MKRLSKVRKAAPVIAFTLLASTLMPVKSQAASYDECGIWLCLPTGFGTGCSGAKSAFKKRIKAFKSPLPSFSSCLSGSDALSSSDNFTAQNGIAAYIPPQRICTKYQASSMQHYDKECVAYETIPERYVKGSRCQRYSDDKHKTPRGCTTTYRYTEVYRNGSKFGQTHYY